MLRGNGVPSPPVEPLDPWWLSLLRLLRLVVVFAVIAFGSGVVAHAVWRLVEWGWWVG